MMEVLDIDESINYLGLKVFFFFSFVVVFYSYLASTTNMNKKENNMDTIFQFQRIRRTKKIFFGEKKEKKTVETKKIATQEKSEKNIFAEQVRKREFLFSFQMATKAQ